MECIEHSMGCKAGMKPWERSRFLRCALRAPVEMTVEGKARRRR
jgi:hypothetical protein